MKKVCLLLVSLMVCSFVKAQTYHDANVGGILFGQGWTQEVGKKYQRFPDRAQSVVPSGVWSLSKNTAGLNVRFVTDAKTITVKYTLTGGALGYTNMPVTLQSGIDMYVHTSDGKYYWVSPQKKFSFSTSCVYTYANLDPKGVSGEDACEYVVYFPMYNGVKSLSVGVDKDNSFEFVPVPEDDEPIVVYGSSIAQGCSASRPGMAWPAIVARELNSNVINLGFSGSAMMESGLFDMMSEFTNAKLFILDAIPNIKSAPSSIISRTLDGVKKLRAVSQAPILLVESLGNSNKVMQPNEEGVDSRGNEKLKEAYQAILDEDIKNVFYLTEEEIGLTEDGMIEGTHPNDIGMREYADAYVEKINWLFENIDTSSVNEKHPLYDIVREAKQMMKSWIFGSNPGETPVGLKSQMETLLADAQDAIDKNTCDAQCEGMKTAIEELMAEIRSTRNPMDEGYYYIVSAYDGFMDYKGYEMGMYTKGSAVNYAKLDSTNAAYVYKFTKTAKGNWAVQNCATGTFINTSAAQKSLVMSNTLVTEQVLKEETAWSARFRMYNTANTLPYIPNSNYFGSSDGADVFNQSTDLYNSADPSSTAYGWYTWYIRQVTDTELLERIINDMKTEETVALEQAMSEVMPIYDRAMDMKADETNALITNGEDTSDGCQFSSNAKMPENTRVWGYYRNLLDGDLESFLITIHDGSLATPPETFHYLQVDLKENPVDAFIFRCGCTTAWPTFAIKDVTVMASNDGENWTQVDELSNLPTTGTYDSKCVRMYKEYRFVRFVVTATKSNSPMVGGGPSFAIGEFQMYPAVSAEDSPYNTNSAVKTETDKLSQLMEQARAKVANNTATAEDAQALKDQADRVLAAIRGDNATEVLEEKMEEAKALYERVFVPVPNTSKALITEADDDDEAHNQFSSNAKMPENTSNWGYYRNMLDNDPATYFITIHSTAFEQTSVPPSGKHYLQVDLKENPVDAFIFHCVPNTTFPTFCWRDLTVSASNDGETWDEITDVNGLPNTGGYDSPCVQLWKTYRYVRFTVNGTDRGLVVGGGDCFCIGDFQMYPVKSDEASAYSTNAAAKTAADELLEAMKTSQELIKNNSALQADVDNLVAKMDAVTASLEGTIQQLETLIEEAKALYDEAYMPVSDESKKLITEADDDDDEHNQFSSNAKMPENTSNWGYYRNMIDNDPATYFITIHSTSYATAVPPTGLHYLQVDLKENPVDAFIFHYVPNTTFPQFSWKDMTISASNDGETWDDITELKGLAADTYDSPCVRMWKSYRHVRFSVSATGNNLIKGGGPCFCIGDFQMYPVKVSANAPYATSTDVKAKTDAVVEDLPGMMAKFNDKSATSDEINAFGAKVAALEEALK